MRERPGTIDDTVVRDALRAWDIEPGTLDYAPVGFGDHHWIASGAGRWFVTVADLADKEHCGTGTEAARRGLGRALETAVALGGRPGLGFVVAPLRTAAGESLRPLPDGRHAISVFPYLEGSAGRFGEELPEPRRVRALETLAALHTARPPAAVPVLRPELPGRARLERALRETGRPWSGGPFSEPARELLADGGLRAPLEEFDRLVRRVREGGAEPVVTHGEPHPGNLLWQGEEARLLDWDTVGLAVPERDLWLVAREPADHARWTEKTGRTPDPAALALYRLRWDLEDVTAFLGWFRSSHAEGPDTALAWEGFSATLERLTEG
ncbi:phosphotransferase [Streptomyces sp. NPDC001985]|uniref:phosphotransferase n=1 Tax=Streptomyces sp. NPDC001985 TaxID=3154406 RepID=UPI0033231BF9